MKKLLIPVALGLGTLALAPAAHATDITNPADHPAPITVTVGGQSYTDGQDTLPGYDDYACTAIPGVSYDFGDNEVVYHTDSGTKTVHWTEWDRIAGYQTWKAQQSSPKPTPSSSAPATSSGTSGGTTTGSKTSAPTKTTSKTSKSTKPKSTPSKTASKAPSASASTSADASASASASVDPSASTSPSAAATSSAAPGATDAAPPTSAAAAPVVTDASAAPTADASPVSTSTQLSSAVTDSVGKGAGNTTLAGGAILAALALASVALLLGHALRSAVGRRVRS